MKTVLAPDAPWPKEQVEKPKPEVKKRAPLKGNSKRQQTDVLFEAWANKNLGGKKK